MEQKEKRKINKFLKEQTKASEKRLRSLLKPFFKFLSDKDINLDDFSQTEIIEYIDEGKYKEYAERVKNGNKEKLAKETLLQVYYGLIEFVRFQRDGSKDREERFRHIQRLAQINKLKKKRLKPLTRNKESLSNRRKWMKLIELDQLFEHTWENKNFKDFACFYLLGYFGTRRGELFGRENIVDIDWEENRLVVSSEKSFYDRVLFFDNRTKKIFRKSIESGWLSQFPYWKMKEYKRLFQEIDLSPHNFRYSFNHHMKNAINNLVLKNKINEDPDLLLKSLMGHTTDRDMSKYYDSAKEKTIEMIMKENHYYDDLQITEFANL